MTEPSRLCFVCVGAGCGKRFGADKLSEQLGENTIFATSLAALSGTFPDALLVAVVSPMLLEQWREQLQPDFPEARFVPGGPRRQDSVKAGLDVAVEWDAEVVAIHDAARPLVHPLDIKGVVWALGNAPGAILCTRVVDTVKRVNENGLVVDTVQRENLRLAQTPQVFQLDAVLRALDKVDPEFEWSDESTLLESAGMHVRCVLAQHPNPKLTTSTDLRLMRLMFEEGI